MNCNYVLRVCGVGFELVSQTRNMRVDRACVERSVFAPNVMEQLFARDSLAGMGNQELQKFKFPRTEIEGLAFLRRSESPQIKGYVADRENFRLGLRMLGAPQHRFDAGQELAHVEWLGNVIVRSEFQTEGCIRSGAARGQHDHGSLDSCVAQTLTNFKPADLGQH